MSESDHIDPVTPHSKWIDEDARRSERVVSGIRIVKRVFSACALLLIFDVGKDLWPAWLLSHQIKIVLIIALTVFVLTALTPLMISITENQRQSSDTESNPDTHSSVTNEHP